MYTLSNTLLSLENISLNFGTKPVLRDINLSVRDIIGGNSSGYTGQVITLVGKSGSGKSTLFKVIAGMLKPTTGTVKIGMDQNIVCTGEVGMVLQNYPLLKHRTLRSNLSLVNKDKGKIDQYLVDFDLWEHKDKYPTQLSGGQRQRGAIVQQLLCSEHFTLLDEPFSGLDPVATDKLCRVIGKVASMDDKNTIIISSHILEPAIAISDTIWILGQENTAAITVSDIATAKIPGSTIIKVDDLAAQGLAWNENIKQDPRFTQKIEEVRQIFHQI